MATLVGALFAGADLAAVACATDAAFSFTIGRGALVATFDADGLLATFTGPAFESAGTCCMTTLPLVMGGKVFFATDEAGAALAVAVAGCAGVRLASNDMLREIFGSVPPPAEACVSN